MDRAGVCLSVNGIVKVTLKEIDTLCTTGERGSKEETRGERGGGNLIVHGLLEFSLSLSLSRERHEKYEDLSLKWLELLLPPRYHRTVYIPLPCFDRFPINP